MRKPNQVNLLSGERPRLRTDPATVTLLVAMVATGLVCAGYSQRLQGRIERQNQALHQVDAEVAGLEQSLPQLHERRQQVLELQDQLRRLGGLRQDPRRYAAILWEVARLLPENFWLSNFSIEPGSTTVQLQGTVAALPGHPPLATMSGFMAALGQSPVFQHPRLKATSRTQLGFRVDLEVSYDPRAAQNLGSRLSTCGGTP